MPIYGYQCEACGHTFDKLQKVSDAPLTTCPECNKDTLKKQISAPAFHLKGSGWYVTDFKDGKNSTSKSTASSTETSQSSTETTSSKKDSDSTKKD